MDWRDAITFDPKICHGQPCLRGTRILVSVVLDNLATGVPVPEILTSYSGLTADHIPVCLAYAADLARERVLALPA